MSDNNVSDQNGALEPVDPPATRAPARGETGAQQDDVTTDGDDPFRTANSVDQPAAAAAVESPIRLVAGYELLGVLGRGGMGIVYRARQVRANREVALKMILSGDHAGAAEIARFRAEGEAVARLQHPHIVTVYEIGEHEGRPYFSMEYCSGGSLATAPPTPLTPRSAAELILKTSRGVAAAHAAGIVHRDLKPGNVLLAADGAPKVSDFGLAKQLRAAGARAHELTSSGAVLGTPSYMAPEQAGGAKRVGPPADVYALGVILYELLVGRPPFRGPTPTDTLLLLLTEDPQPPREVCPTVPRDLEAICLRCLAKDPARRYPTATELAEDLERFLAGESVSASGSGLVARLAGSLERVQLQERFAAYESLMLALIPVMLLSEVWVTVSVWNQWPMTWVGVGQFGRVAAFLAVFGYHRQGRWWPQGPAERQLWAVWSGYIAACFFYGVSSRLWMGFVEPEVELKLYQALACMAALAFFALAGSFWGYCGVIGVAFLALSFVMAIDLRWAPLEYGITWAVVLGVVAWRLRRLNRSPTGDR